jgi:hypothetical protein
MDTSARQRRGESIKQKDFFRIKQPSFGRHFQAKAGDLPKPWSKTPVQTPDNMVSALKYKSS